VIDDVAEIDIFRLADFAKSIANDGRESGGFLPSGFLLVCGTLSFSGRNWRMFGLAKGS